MLSGESLQGHAEPGPPAAAGEAAAQRSGLLDGCTTFRLVLPAVPEAGRAALRSLAEDCCSLSFDEPGSEPSKCAEAPSMRFGGRAVVRPALLPVDRLEKG